MSICLYSGYVFNCCTYIIIDNILLCYYTWSAGCHVSLGLYWRQNTCLALSITTQVYVHAMQTLHLVLYAHSYNTCFILKVQNH